MAMLYSLQVHLVWGRKLIWTFIQRQKHVYPQNGVVMPPTYFYINYWISYMY